ncbi:MAG: hypothetical protein WCG26_03970 [Chloroflexales bacterium]
MEDRGRRHWTRAEDETLQDLVGCGWSTRRIAGVLRRPITSIYTRARRWGGIDALRHRLFAVRSGREIRDLMGVRIHILHLWIDRGWLRVHRAYGRKSRNARRLRMLIPDEALDALLAKREGWPTWEPAQIADRDWRARAEEYRANAGGRWVRADTLAKELRVPVRVAQTWVQAWVYVGTRPTIKVGGCWHVWVHDGDKLDVLITLQRKKRRKRDAEKRPLDQGDGRPGDDHAARADEGTGGV